MCSVLACSETEVIHGLLNNAGTFAGDYTGKRQVTAEGNEYSPRGKDNVLWFCFRVSLKKRWCVCFFVAAVNSDHGAAWAFLFGSGKVGCQRHGSISAHLLPTGECSRIWGRRDWSLFASCTVRHSGQMGVGQKSVPKTEPW